ncbi:MAG TPA: serine hydrolase [Woeseiaceae bacterium]|nr:serine hydrolase [Woeseiaceae bacterium]
MKSNWMNARLALLLATLMSGAVAVGAETDRNPISDAAIDRIAEQVMQHYAVPGMAVGIIRNGKIVHASGYGVLESGKRQKVNGRTLFKIASNSKAITATALAILVDEGLLAWDDKIIDHLPEFQLYDPWVTREFTVIDMLTHRSGLAPYVGDMMLWPEPNNFTRADIVHNLRYFKPVSSFRSEYAYDNQMYIVAGELVNAVAGQSWESFVDERIFGVLGFKRCFAGQVPANEMTNLAAPHWETEGKIEVIERSRILARPITSAAAGGIRCSLDDLLTWINVQLDEGAMANGKPLISEEQHAAMWQPRTILPISDNDRERDHTHFRAYGLGWRLADVQGYLEVSHTGTLSGWNSYVSMIPDLDLGAVVLTNGSSSDARRAMMYSVIRPWLGVTDVDWIARVDEERQRDKDKRPEQGPQQLCDSCETGKVLAPLATYAGTYRDRWFGDILVVEDSDGLAISSSKSPLLTGRLLPYLGNTFIARWDDRNMDGDAWVTFSGDTPNEIDRMSMSAISDTSDFDLEEMELERVP